MKPSKSIPVIISKNQIRDLITKAIEEVKQAALAGKMTFTIGNVRKASGLNPVDFNAEYELIAVIRQIESEILLDVSPDSIKSSSPTLEPKPAEEVAETPKENLFAIVAVESVVAEEGNGERVKPLAINLTVTEEAILKAAVKFLYESDENFIAKAILHECRRRMSEMTPKQVKRMDAHFEAILKERDRL